jgi:hypothetical protein
MSLAKMGKSTIANARNVAKKSTKMVDHNSVFDLTKVRPSLIEFKETTDFSPPGSPVCFISRSARRTAIVEIASMP